MFRLQCKIVILLWGFILLAACGTSRLSQVDISRELAAPDNILQPYFSVLHQRDSSYLICKLPTMALLYKNTGDATISSVSIHFDLYQDYESTTNLDSGTVSFVFPESLDKNFHYLKIPFKIQLMSKGILKVKLTDDFRKQSVDRLILVNKDPLYLHQRYYLTDTLYQMLGINYVSVNESFILHESLEENRKLVVRCYFQQFPHPAPPFSVIADPFFSFKPDSVFEIALNGINALTLSRKGIYHFQIDSSLKAGYTVFVVDEYFPEIKSAAQMLMPLRYLTTRKEYEEILSTPDQKAAVDKFWLKMGGHNDRSRAMIRIYYQRIQEANRRFSSYTEGWKTDRGMIYTILGPPATVYRSSTQEEWTYSSGVMANQVFTFRHIGNPFTENDFSLRRDEKYKLPWYETVEQWRQGNIRLHD